MGRIDYYFVAGKAVLDRILTNLFFAFRSFWPGGFFGVLAVGVYLFFANWHNGIIIGVFIREWSGNQPQFGGESVTRE